MAKKRKVAKNPGFISFIAKGKKIAFKAKRGKR